MKRGVWLALAALVLIAVCGGAQPAGDAVAADSAAAAENGGDIKYVALTFDDGPWPETTEQLLDGLAERGAKATFFLIGEQLAGHEDTVRRMADEGHQVGSHTFTHMDLSRGDPAERLREIAATDETLRALLGDGVYWLRPPWGFLAPHTAAAVEVPMVTGRWIRRTGAGWTPTPWRRTSSTMPATATSFSYTTLTPQASRRRCAPSTP